MAGARATLDDMRSAEDVLLEARTARARAARRRVMAATGGGVMLGLIGGAAAAVLFSAGIARRIAEVTANARHLAEGEPLASTPPARDEVGQLAASLSAASALLRERDDLLQRRLAALTKSNAELESFSYSVSHDLRAPLRHIAGFGGLLEKRLGAVPDAEAARYVRTIIESAARMGRLVDDLLSFSRMGRMKMNEEPVDLNAVVRDVVREIEHEVSGRQIRWTTHPLPAVTGDPALMRLAFSNLISNAVKYTQTRNVAEIEIGAQPVSNGERVVYVRDNGVGFEMAYVHKLFGVFERLHSTDAFEGTGIGLANVRRIIARHGGRTWAEGAVDRGATFFMSLPVERELGVAAPAGAGA
jgi:light-regulated signal transduction histidine kinase (bacteriophytochrome)